MTLMGMMSVVSGVVGVIVWLVRLEASSNQTRDRHKDLLEKLVRLEQKYEALDTRIVEKLSVIEKSLAKIEGRLSLSVKQGE